ncbi:hypothetical protein MXZ84_10770, partial [Streptococcus uberis]|nr:hypothetical protein [Streptococcus uberis]
MTYTYDKREVTHGNAFGFFAKISQAVSGGLEIGTPHEFTGLRANSFETSQESNAYHADNVEHVRLQGAKTTEGTYHNLPISRASSF